MSLWTILRVGLKVLGMGFVIASCLMFIKQASIYKALTHDGQPFANVIFVSLIFVVWGYNVIWKPLDTVLPPRKRV